MSNINRRIKRHIALLWYFQPFVRADIFSKSSSYTEANKISYFTAILCSHHGTNVSAFVFANFTAIQATNKSAIEESFITTNAATIWNSHNKAYDFTLA